MRKETKRLIISTVLKSALASFLFGTILLIVLIIMQQSISIYIGFSYVLIAALLNLIILFAIIISVFINNDYQWKALFTLIVMLLNIPIVFLYLRIFMYGFQININ